ncbi:MAG: Nif3-like dinuclear metal center hexameric protein [Actinomycetia bacterium]|nr:Nif3-like dinuclear metal center hexameric protein [Actinomycetes bacterium]
MIVADALSLLEARYPPGDAEPWDRVGLLSGDSTGLVGHVVCALDPDIGTLLRAQAAGADLLVTHHPTYLPSDPDSPASVYGVGLEQAAREMGIALISCHTNLDVSEEARLSLGAGLSLKSQGSLAEYFGGKETYFEKPGYAQLWSVERKTRIAQIADRLSRFYRAPVYRTTTPAGPDQLIFSVVTAAGSGGDALEATLARHADLLICGELKYHQRLEANDRGLCIIELGHDISEWPLVTLLYDALKPACEGQGVKITLLKPARNSEVIVARKDRR